MNNLIPKSSLSSEVVDTKCSSCHLCKSHVLPFASINKRASRPFEVICSDVWGPAPITSFSGSKYYLIFIDSYSRYTWIFFMKHKSEVFGLFQKFHSFVQNHFSTNILNFQCDGGGEFSSSDFVNFLQHNGIKRRVSCPHTPQQNGIAERKHRHIVETAMSMMHGSNLPVSLWTEAFHSTVHVINRLPMSILENKSPYFSLFGIQPDYHELRVFGSVCYVHIDSSLRHKFQDKALKCRFIGYAEDYKGYRCYDPLSKRVKISRNVIFDEMNFADQDNNSTMVDTDNSSSSIEVYYPWLNSELFSNGKVDCPENCSQKEPHEDSANETQTEETVTYDLEPTRYKGIVYTRREKEPSFIPCTNTDPSGSSASQQMDIRRSSRIRHPLDRWVSYKKFSLDFQLFLTSISKEDEPLMFYQAASSRRWVEAMNEEMEALHECGTWEIVPRPLNRNVVGSKWVYKIKYKPDGSIERYKARLVAKGFTQEEGQDFDETFSPVVKMGTIRIVLSLAIKHGWTLSQLDVKNAFLHGDLKEEVYMEQPTGYAERDAKKYVCKLKRALYGLKQASRSWFDSFSLEIQRHGFSRSLLDHSLFIHNEQGVTTLLLIYVDDIIITGNCKSHIEQVKKLLNQRFKMKDLGELRYFLGVEVDNKK